MDDFGGFKNPDNMLNFESAYIDLSWSVPGSGFRVQRLQQLEQDCRLLERSGFVRRYLWSAKYLWRSISGKKQSSVINHQSEIPDITHLVKRLYKNDEDRIPLIRNSLVFFNPEPCPLGSRSGRRGWTLNGSNRDQITFSCPPWMTLKRLIFF